MSQKRKPQTATPAVPSTASSEVPAEAPGGDAPEARPERKGMIWRVLTGAVVLALVFIGVTVYQQLQAQLTELRSELGALNKETRRELASMGERQGGFAKRADHDSRVRQIWDSLKELRNDRSDLGRLKERCGLLLDLYKAGEDERRQLLADVRKLSEKKSGEDNKELLRELRTLRDRIAQIESAPKTKITPTGHTEVPEKR